MGVAERRPMILKKLCIRRHDTISNLAVEFGVSERTMRRDVEALSLTEPIYTVPGRYGGVFVVDGYHINDHKFTKEQSLLMIKILDNADLLSFTEAEIRILSAIIDEYSTINYKE